MVTELEDADTQEELPDANPVDDHTDSDSPPESAGNGRNWDPSMLQPIDHDGWQPSQGWNPDQSWYPNDADDRPYDYQPSWLPSGGTTVPTSLSSQQQAISTAIDAFQASPNTSAPSLSAQRQAIWTAIDRVNNSAAAVVQALSRGVLSRWRLRMNTAVTCQSSARLYIARCRLSARLGRRYVDLA
jgi:hypothetical protein